MYGEVVFMEILRENNAINIPECINVEKFTK